MKIKVVEVSALSEIYLNVKCPINNTSLSYDHSGYFMLHSLKIAVKNKSK